MKKILEFILVVVFLLVISKLLIGFISMDKEVGRLIYSKTLEESCKEKVLINTYNLYNSDKKQIGTAWLEYARSTREQ